MTGQPEPGMSMMIDHGNLSDKQKAYLDILMQYCRRPIKKRAAVLTPFPFSVTRTGQNGGGDTRTPKEIFDTLAAVRKDVRWFPDSRSYMFKPLGNLPKLAENEKSKACNYVSAESLIADKAKHVRVMKNPNETFPEQPTTAMQIGWHNNDKDGYWLRKPWNIGS